MVIGMPFIPGYIPIGIVFGGRIVLSVADRVALRSSGRTLALAASGLLYAGGQLGKDAMTTPLYNGADAAFPGEPLPPGTRLLCAYVGLPGVDRPDTPHVWTAEEWNGYIRSTPNLGVLPIYVHDYDNGDPIGDADNAVDAVLALGWAPNMPGSFRRIIFLDYEILVDPPYVEAMERRVYARGFLPVPYGSSYFVRQNPSHYGYWDAIYTFHRPTQLPPGSVGVQYQPGTWDLSVFSQLAWAGAGRGLRHG